MKRLNKILFLSILLFSTQVFANSISDVEADSDISSLSLTMKGSFDKGSHYDFYIDADNNAHTGYSKGEIRGADYLIEDGRIYRYPKGADGWKWTRMDAIAQIETTQHNAMIHIPKETLSLAQTIRVGASVETDDFSHIEYYPRMQTFLLKPEISDGITVRYEESGEIIKNPERGLYAIHYLPTSDYSGDRSIPGRLDWIESGPYTTFVEKLVLVDFKNAPISQSYIDKVKEEFDLIRKAGLKMILRVTYNEHMGEEDAPINTVLKHIEQLKPVLEENKDIIMALEAGYVGAWGEWHSSTHNLTTFVNMKKIKDALMQNVPKGIKIIFRRPSFLMNWYPKPLTEIEANTGSNKSRAGFHDDCFNWNITDMGTFSRDKEERGTQFRYLEQITKYVPVVGEMCSSDVTKHETTTSCKNGIEMAEKFHYSLLGNQVRGSWYDHIEKLPVEVYQEEGCWDEFQKRLGYRFVLKEATLPTIVQSGEHFKANIKIKNKGFSATVNERPVYLVLDNGHRQYKIKVNTDPRKWYAGEEISIDIDKKLPNNLESGEYEIYLWLPDKSESLQNNPKYSIRMANMGIWDKQRGYNRLGATTIGKNIDIASLSLSETPENLTLKIEGAFPKEGHYDFYIDADNDENTGYTNSKIRGADYLIEDGRIYRYPKGAHGWKWTRMDAMAQIETTQHSAMIHIPKETLPLAQTIRVGASVGTDDFSRVVVYPEMLTYAIEATDDLIISSTDYIVDQKTFIMNGRFPQNPHFAFYIDSDNNPTTGYSSSPNGVKGADYLIQDAPGKGAVYKYTGNGTNWRWSKVGNTNLHKNSTQASVKISQKLIPMSNSFRYAANVSLRNWSNHSFTKMKQVETKDANAIVLGSDRLKVTFSKTTGGIVLKNISTNDRSILQSATSLFDLSIANVNDLAHPVSLKADSGWQNVSMSQNGNKATLIWSHPIEPNLPASLSVTATVETSNTNATWDLKVQGLDAHHTLMDTVFPQLDIKADGDDHLFVPFKFGKVIDNPATNAINFNNLKYPGGWQATMQFMAYYNDSYGLYLGIHDPQANIKKLQATHRNGAVHIAVTIPAPNKTRAGNDWEFPGEFETDIFSGDWYDAAMIYKRWVYKKADYRPSQILRESTKNLKNIDIWGVMNIYGDSKNRDNTWLVDNIKDANQALNPKGKHSIDFATYFLAASGKVNEDDMPRFYPSQTTKYINEQLRQAGISTMMYTNGYGYDIDIQDYDDMVPLFEDMKAYAAKNRNGDYYRQPWTTVAITTARMCPTQKRWQEVLANVHSNKIAPLGLSGILLDQMSAANAVECFDKTHGHPLGGGHYWRDGYKTLINRIRSVYPAGTFLVTEGASDDMIDMVDGFELIHNYIYDGTVPAMSVLYGDKTAFIGISAGARDFYDYNEMYALKAYSFALGMTTGYFFMEFQNSRNVVEYLRKLSILKEKLEAYISYGDMVRKPIVTIENNPTIHITRDGLEMDTNALQYSAWKSKDGKSVAFVFINGQEPSKQALEFSFDIDAARYGLHGNLTLKRITQNSEENVQINGNSQNVILEAADAVAYILNGE